MIARHYHGRGFTLVELSIVLLILSIVVTQAVPFLGSVLASSERHSSASELIALLNVARHTAVSEGRTVTVCALDVNDKCTGSWSNPVVAFRDPKRKGELDSPNQVIRVLEPNNRGIFHAHLGIRNYLRFRSTGMAREAIGNVVWCPKNGDLGYAFQIRINMGGRIHRAIDTDGDGVVEGAKGLPISCP